VIGERSECAIPHTNSQKSNSNYLSITDRKYEWDRWRSIMAL